MRLDAFRRCLMSWMSRVPPMQPTSSMPSMPLLSLVGLMLLMLASPARAYDAPTGWTMRVVDDGLLQQPADLPPGKVMQLWAAPPLEVGRAQGLDAFARIREPLRGLGASGQPACHAPETLTAGIVVQSCVVTVAGAAVETQVYMRPPRDGKVEWLRIAFSQEEALLQRYGDGLKSITGKSNELWPTLHLRSAADIVELFGARTITEATR